MVGNMKGQLGPAKEIQAYSVGTQILKIELTGLYIDAHFPDLGASPDALVNCDCHSMGVLEIECPEKNMNGLFNWQNDKKFPVTETDEIKRNHTYFYQMQVQILLTKWSYYKFFVWSKGNEI